MRRSHHDEPVSAAELVENIERISRIAGKGVIRLSEMEAENKRLREAMRGLFVRLDHPLNGSQRVAYFLRWPEVEAARAALGHQP